MLIPHIPAWIEENGADPDCCGIDEERDERICIVSMHGVWEVFFKERGIRSMEKRFHVEADAVRYFIELVSNDRAVMKNRR